MKIEILKYCAEKGLLLDREVAEILSNLSENAAREIIEKVSLLKGRVISKSFLNENATNLRAIVSSAPEFEKICINLGIKIEISREIQKPEPVEEKRIESFGNIRVLYSASSPTKKMEVQDFTKYFRARYNELRRVLQDRPELDNLISINKIGNQRQNFSLIGIVYKKRVTKNKNIMLDIEDLTGRISVLVNQGKEEVFEKAKDVITDSVIGIRGNGTKEMLFVNDIIFPDVILRDKNFIDRDESAAFISDIHVGSKMFLEKEFLRFIFWLNGELGDKKQREEAKKIKYLFITGDTIDGIGVYPGQENMLVIKDIIEQYKKLAEYLSRLRKDITMILCPGQHDAVRIAEPQPVLGKEYAWPLHDIDNLILVSNPSLIEIGNNGKRGIKVLMYHGASMNSIIPEIESLRTIRAHDTPSKIVRHMLKARHLAPIHSSVTYIPSDKSDELAILDVPDIITTADLHKPDVDIYNNILIICSSCWQSITPFEEKVGNHPDPCKVPILNLKTRALKIMDFSSVEDENLEEKTCEEKNSEIVCSVEEKAGK